MPGMDSPSPATPPPQLGGFNAGAFGSAAATLVALHQLHFSSTIIAKLTGFSFTEVRAQLALLGHAERWENLADVRAGLPLELLAQCDELQRRRRPRLTSCSGAL